MNFNFFRKNMFDCQSKLNKIIDLYLINASYRVFIEILNHFSDDKKLVAFKIEESHVEKATLYQTDGNEFMKNYIFDPYIPVFYCFKKIQNFNF